MAEQNPHRAEQLVAQFTAHGLTLATCESLTGGLVAAAITEVPGASRIFRGGLVTYASDLKHQLAGVDAAWIAAHGVVNPETAEQMARGTRELLGVDWAVSCTGVAGPDPQDGVAPGTAWLGLAGPGIVTHQLVQVFGGRAQVRARCVARALEFVLNLSR